MRLTNAIREDIVKALIAHKFAKEWELMAEESTAFMLKVFRSVLTKEELAWHDSATGAFASSVGVVRVISYFGGQMCTRNFPKGAVRLCPEGVQSRMRFAADHPFTIELASLNEKEERYRVAQRKAKREAEAVLGSVQNLKQLLEVWPEIEPFCPKPEPKKTTAIAIRREELNSTFGLPVETTPQSEN